MNMLVAALICVLVPQGDSKVAGTLMLTQEKGYVHITGEISGLKPGLHGFHVHNYGDLRDSKKGMTAGGHYAGKEHQHGGPESMEHHAGDLGNIDANESGVAKIDIMAKGLTLGAIVGRSLVVHADADDLKSQPAGNSGPRIGVGVIGIMNTEPPAKK